MTLTLTHDQMLATWRLTRYHEPLNDSLSMVEEDGFGVDTDRLHAIEMKAWYLRLLDTAPLQWLPVTDISDDVAMRLMPDGSGVIDLPTECHRVVSVALDCWDGHPAIITHPDTPPARLQRSPLTRGGQQQPVVVVTDRQIRLYTPLPGARVTSLRCVMEPSDGHYTFDEQALATINQPDYHSK